MVRRIKRNLLFCCVLAAMTLFVLKFMLRSTTWPIITWTADPAPPASKPADQLFLEKHVRRPVADLNVTARSQRPFYEKEHSGLNPNQARMPPLTSDACPCDFGSLEVKIEEAVMKIETNEDALIPYFKSHGFRVKKGLSKRSEVLDPVLEMPLFHYPPLTHHQCLPDQLLSKVYVINPQDHNVVGDKIQFRVDLYTGCGAPRKMGGDEVRAWLKSIDGKSSVAAKVIDFQNGTYVGESVLNWPGVTLVRVSLTYPREFLRAVVELQHSLHSMRWSTNSFDNGKGVKEFTPCLPSAPVPGFANTCNLTSTNGGRPWFCGHPLKRGLNCSHWREVDNLPYLSPLPLSSPLKKFVAKLDKCCLDGRTPDLRLIENDIRIEAHESRSRPVLPPCWSKPVRESWEGTTPRGWLRNGTWLSHTCTLPDLTPKRVKRCMQNTSLLLLGDSNQRLLWFKTKERMGCHQSIIGHSHAPHLCRNFAINSTMLFVAHAQPFNTGSHAGLIKTPLPQALQRIRRYSSHDNNIIVVIHYFMHLTTQPVQVYRRMVQDARRDVEEFLRLHPKTKFFVRGPHVLYQGNHHHANIGDNFAHWYSNIWKEEFEGLLDRVWFIDTWDLTIASENLTNHPEPVADEIVKILFGYMCDV